VVGDGKTSNRAGIGARVTVKAGGKSFVREIGGGYGHMAMQNDTVLLFGVGACDAVDEVSVRWPDRDATVETWKSVPVGRYVELRRGDPQTH
jgi:hypothetical protein